MNEIADRIIAYYDRHARDWDADRNAGVESWRDRPWHERFVAALPGRPAFSISAAVRAPRSQTIWPDTDIT